MKFNLLLIFLLLTGCSNLELTGETETVYSSGIQRSVNKTKIQYKTEYGDVPVTFTSAIIHDMKNLNKPVNVASSAEIWFW
jgi:hypothetical protein